MQDRAREILAAIMRYSFGRYQLLMPRGGPRLWFAFGLLWLLVQQGCVPSPYVYVGPDKTGDGLLTAAASDVKMNTKPLVQMIDQVRQGRWKNIHSVLVMRQGKLVLESYFHGYSRSKRHDLRSTTKSITAMLVGIAIDKGWIPHENTLVSSFFPAHPLVKAWKGARTKLTIRHLLTMSSGFACNDHDPRSPGQEDKMYKTRDWSAFVLALGSARPPGQRFMYCTGGVVLLGAILQKASKMTIPTLAQRYLFGPLEIREARWSFMPTGLADTGGHLYLTPRAMAKIGQLVLQKGRWQGKQVLSQGWIQRMIRSQIRQGQVDYGYLWWRKRGRNAKTRQTIDLIHTSGNGGQYIFVVPRWQLVVVFTGGNYNSPLANQPFGMLAQIFRSILSFRASHSMQGVPSPAPTTQRSAP